MKSLTKEQIEQIIIESTQQATENISEILLENLNSYLNDLKDTDLYSRSTEFAMISTCTQISVEILRESLIKIFAD